MPEVDHSRNSELQGRVLMDLQRREWTLAVALVGNVVHRHLSREDVSEREDWAQDFVALTDLPRIRFLLLIYQ